MPRQIRTVALGAAAFAASLAALAQAGAPGPAALPASGAYNSAFEGYRPFAAEEIGDWRQANETVREIGGWRAYAREIQGGSTATAPSSGAAATPAGPAAAVPSATPARPANPHQGHQR